MDHKRNRTQQTTEMETYECEAILKSRKREGKVQYLIKWRGYSSNMNSWEPSENLNSELLAKLQEIDDKISKEESEHSDTYRYGFERGLTAEKILGLRTEGDELQFLIKWKKSTEGEFVPAKLANEKCPQLVIKYYEEKILWKGSDDSD